MKLMEMTVGLKSDYIAYVGTDRNPETNRFCSRKDHIGVTSMTPKASQMDFF